MEKLIKIEANLVRLKSRVSKKPVSAEIQGIKIGDFVLISFPGELFARVGLNIKEKSPYEHTFMAAYSNGYIHYAATSEAFLGWAYEDMRSILSPDWQKIYEQRILQIISEL